MSVRSLQVFISGNWSLSLKCGFASINLFSSISIPALAVLASMYLDSCSFSLAIHKTIKKSKIKNDDTKQKYKNIQQLSLQVNLFVPKIPQSQEMRNLLEESLVETFE